MGKLFVGLDVGSTTCHLVAMDREGRIREDRQFGTSESNLIATVEKLKGEVHVHLETSELTAWVLNALKGRVAKAVAGHAKSSAWIAKDPLKRDQLDASKLADLLRMDRVHEVFYTDDKRRQVLKQLVQHYDDIVSQETRLKHKIKSRFRAQGIIARGVDVYTVDGRAYYLGLISEKLARDAMGQLYDLLDHALDTQKRTIKVLRRESRDFPEIPLLEGVPGIGIISACRFSVYIQTPHRFSSKRKLWRYCRLGVTDRSSDGKPLGHKALDWNGNTQLKALSRSAYVAAMKRRDDNAFKRAYRQGLESTHNRDHARLTTQRKILTVLWTLWKRGEEYRDDMDK